LNPKNPKDELLDILIEIPGIMEDIDELLACSPEQVDKQVGLLRPLGKQFWFLIPNYGNGRSLLACSRFVLWNPSSLAKIR
jgi:hypothetical protein